MTIETASYILNSLIRLLLPLFLGAIVACDRTAVEVVPGVSLELAGRRAEIFAFIPCNSSVSPIAKHRCAPQHIQENAEFKTTN